MSFGAEIHVELFWWSQQEFRAQQSSLSVKSNTSIRNEIASVQCRSYATVEWTLEGAAKAN